MSGTPYRIKKEVLEWSISTAITSITMITVKYFASLREHVGRSQDTLDTISVTTVEDVWRRISNTPEFPPNVLIAVNMEYANMDHPVKDGDEVAFFPPVTGG